MNKTKKGIVAFLLAAVLLISMVGMASADSQTWSVHDTAYTGTPAIDGQTPHALDKMMTVPSGCTGSYKEVTISSSTPAWWYDKKAQINGSFGTSAGNVWGVKIYHNSTTVQGKYIFGEVWLVWDDGTLVKKLASGTGRIPIYEAGWTNFDLLDNPAENQDFKVDHRLGLKIYTNDSTGFKIRYDGSDACSELESPPTDPGFPVPELPTIILMSTGLLALFGYVVYRRRNNKSQ